jgi:hypothetical protein
MQHAFIQFQKVFSFPPVCLRQWGNHAPVCLLAWGYVSGGAVVMWRVNFVCSRPGAAFVAYFEKPYNYLDKSFSD